MYRVDTSLHGHCSFYKGGGKAQGIVRCLVANQKDWLCFNPGALIEYPKTYDVKVISFVDVCLMDE